MKKFRPVYGVVVTIILLIATVIPVGHVSAEPVDSQSSLAVAIHVSEYTRDFGLTLTHEPGYDYPWYYYQIYTLLEEALIADGTPFVEVSDADIASGQLLTSSGTPRYPILISLAAECISDAEATAISSYVSSGGFVYVGSSSWTRRDNGTYRTSFALAAEMGLNSASVGTGNWANIGDPGMRIQRIADHPLVEHLTKNLNTPWPMPNAYNDILKLFTTGSSLAHRAWTTTIIDATPLVVIEGTNTPFLAIKQSGNGWYIYHSELAPLAGWGDGHAALLEYTFFRKAIDWAFQAQHLPQVRISAWPYPYQSAYMIRHDDIVAMPTSYYLHEEALGVHGQYFIITGRTDPATIVDQISTALSHGVIVGSHSVEHTCPDIMPLPDAYNNVNDSLTAIESWTGVRPTVWVSPMFGAILDKSFQIIEDCGIKASGGEQSIGPFPHYALSMTEEKKHYSFLELPPTFWISSAGNIRTSNDGPWSLTDIYGAVDLIYNEGGLVNIYDHLANAVFSYITYAMSKPYMWATNSTEIADWWEHRSAVSVSSHYYLDGDDCSLTINVSGADDPLVTLDIISPNLSPVAVTLDGSASSNFRQTGSKIKINSGTASTVTVAWNAANIPPVANNDVFSVVKNNVLIQDSPGVLANDTDLENDPLTAILVDEPANGTLALETDGSFIYTPDYDFVGDDSFTYRANDGSNDSNIATVNISITGPVFTFGLDNGNASWKQGQGVINVQRFLNTAGSGTMTKLEIYMATTTPSGKVRLAVYADTNGSPGALLADAGEATVVNGWIALGVDVPVLKNTYYWLGYNLETANSVWYQSGQATSSHRWVGYDYGPFPAQFPTSGVISNNNQYVMRASVGLKANFVPVASNDNYSVMHDTMLMVVSPGVLGNDTDGDDDPLTAVLAVGPGHGALNLSTNGAFDYTPDPGFIGNDTFTYMANDGFDNSNAATVRITVTPSLMTFGLDGGNNTWRQNAGVINAQRFLNTAASGTLNKLEILMATTPAGKIKLGIYADQGGVPGVLLLDAGEVTVTNGWVAIYSLDLHVTQYTYYWLVFNSQERNGVVYQSGQPTNSHCYVTYNYALPLPNPFPEIPKGSSNNNEYVMRGSVLPDMP
jgi:peptidoglycan/xylan/chitin deacetylase (PgdA/CDA1 family)